MNFFQHEMRIAALLRRHRIPGNFFDWPLNGFSFAIEEAVRAERYFANFTVFEKCYSARVVEQCRDIRSDESFALAPTDDNRRGILCHDQAFGIATIQKQQRVGAVDLLERAPDRVEKIHAALD